MILPISILTLFSKVTRASSNPFESITISPLYSNGTKTIVVAKTKVMNVKLNVYIDNDKFDSKSIIEETMIWPGTHVFYYDNEFTRINNKIYLAVTHKNKTTNSEKIQMRMTSPGYDDLNTHSELYSDNQLSVLNQDFVWEQKKTNYIFEDFDNYYVPDYFQKFDLSDFSITIPDDEREFFGFTAKLVIEYKNGVFDNISGADDGYVEFPLKTRITNSKYHLLLENNLYVDPNTLNLSSQKLDGYVLTKHIYFPLNSMKNQDDYYCYFMFENFGIDKDSIFHRFHIKALKNIVGDCHNSKYCVQKLYK